MKNRVLASKNLVLASIAVITLSLTGFSAVNGFSAPAKTKGIHSQTNGMPIPVCPPSDANACGM